VGFPLQSLARGLGKVRQAIAKKISFTFKIHPENNSRKN